MDAFEFDIFYYHHLLSLPSSAPRSFFRSNAPSPSKDWSGWKLYFCPDLFFWNNVKYSDLWFITKLPCCPRREYAGTLDWKGKVYSAKALGWPNPMPSIINHIYQKPSGSQNRSDSTHKFFIRTDLGDGKTLMKTTMVTNTTMKRNASQWKWK